MTKLYRMVQGEAIYSYTGRQIKEERVNERTVKGSFYEGCGESRDLLECMRAERESLKRLGGKGGH